MITKSTSFYCGVWYLFCVLFLNTMTTEGGGGGGELSF